MELRTALLALALLAASSPALAQGFDDAAAASEAGNYAEAYRIWHPHALDGNAGAQFNLDILYANGWGVAQDHAEAARWFRRSAENGYDRAQFKLGSYYSVGQGVNGRGITQDSAKAIHWIRLAAEQGKVQAQRALEALGVK